MPLSIPPSFTLGEYLTLINNNVINAATLFPTFFANFQGFGAQAGAILVTGELRNARGDLSNLYNLQESAFGTLLDIDASLAAIAAAGPGSVSVDLATTEFWLSNINDKVASISMAVGGGAPLGIGDINTTLQSYLQGVIDQLAQIAANEGAGTGGIVLALTAGVPGTLGNAVDVGLTNINTTLAALNTLVALTSGAADPATQSIADNTKNSAQLDLAAALGAAVAGKAPLDDYLKFLTASDIGVVGDTAWEFLKTIIVSATPPPWKVEVSAAIDGFIATGAKKGLGVALSDSVHYLVAGEQSVISGLIKKVIDAVGPIAETLEGALNALFKPAFDVMIGGVKSVVKEVGEVKPGEGFSAAEKFLTKAAINGMHAHHLSELMEMIPWTKHFGMNTLPAFLSDMAGFGEIARQTWGRAVGEGVGRMAGYEINASMRSRIPDPRTLEQMVFEGQLSEADQAVLLGFSGLNDDYIARVQKIQYVEPNLRQLSGLAADATMPEAQVETWLREIGFSTADATALLPIVMQQSMKAERGSLETEVMANLKAGLLGEDDADLYFDQLRLHPLARQMNYTTARLGLRRGTIEDNVNTYRQQYDAGLIDDGDFELALRAQGVTASRVTTELSQVASKRFAKIADDEAAEVKSEVRKQQGFLLAAMRDAFQHGLIDASQFETTLTHAGLTAATASAAVQLEVTKLEGRALTSRSAEAARIMQREIKLREDTFVELFRKQAITNLQLQQFLLGSGIPEPVVNAIVERELARARPGVADLFKTASALKAKELATLAKAKLSVEFATAQITSDVYLAQLVALGVDEEIARATVALAVARRAGEKQPPAPATSSSKALTELREKVDDALAKFSTTDQTAAGLEDSLARLGIVETVVDSLVALANEKAESVAAGETAVT